MPYANEVTSMNLSSSFLAIIPHIIAAPLATCSSGLASLDRLSIPKYSRSFFWIMGMRVVPPTRMTLSSACLESFELSRASSIGYIILFRTGSHNCSNSYLDSSKLKSPSLISIYTSYSMLLLAERSSFVSWANSLSRALVLISYRLSIPNWFYIRLKKYSTKILSMSCPPRWQSPLVARV